MIREEHQLSESDQFFASLEQGQLLQLSEAALQRIGLPQTSADRLVVLVSQTCDIVLSKRPTVHIAPVVAVPDSEARPENPRYVSAPNLSGRFVDLSWITPAVKDSGLFVATGDRIANRSAERDFALGVARWFGRYPFSDEVAEWLRPLLAVIRKKYSKEESPLGIVLQSVAEIRVSLSDWSGAPCEITVHVIAKAGSVPEVEGQVLDLEPKTRVAVHDSEGDLRPLSVVADALLNAINTDQGAVALHWAFFAEALAAECRLSAALSTDPRFRDAVTGVVAELDSEDEFSLLKVRASEVLDLEYLSASGRS